MERKGGTRTVEVVDSKTVERSVNRTQTLTAEEDKALRMRHGAGVALDAPLARAAGNNKELGDELLLMEMQLLRSFRARGAQSVRAVAKAPRVTATASPTKEKIVRALRKKR